MDAVTSAIATGATPALKHTETVDRSAPAIDGTSESVAWLASCFDLAGEVEPRASLVPRVDGAVACPRVLTDSLARCVAPPQPPCT